MSELRKIDFSTEKYFECGGKKFFVKDSLSFARYRELQKINIEFGYSATFQDIFNSLNKALESFNKHKYDEMCVVIHNVMNGITKLETKDDPALRICALFIDEDGEDPTEYNEAKMKEKIDCWGRGLNIDSFFYFAAALVPYWTNVYELHIRSGLKVEEKSE
jgi:hypothetical protein